MVTTTNSEKAIIEEERILTELEKNAISRRQHLLEMRKRFVGRNQGNGDVDSEQNCGVERFVCFYFPIKVTLMLKSLHWGVVLIRV